MPRVYSRIPVLTRLFAKVNKTASCWIWTGTTNNKGYGQLLIEKRPKHIVKLAHRISWEAVNGEIPDGLYVLHSCDNPLCVNPEHLSLGTQKKNMEDCSSRGRAVGRRKIDEATVLAIRSESTGARGESSKIAKKYGMSREMIGNIIARRSWKHI